MVMVILSASGCTKKPAAPALGHHIVLTADPYLPLIQQEVEQYLSLYPQIKAVALGVSTREAVVHLLNDSVRTIVLDRSFNQEERDIALHASMKIVESKLAEDGIAMIIHPQNPLSYITAESIQKIVNRSATDWTQIPESRRSGSIDLVLTGRNSGMYELLQRKIFPGSKPLEPATVMNNQDDVVQYVSTHPLSVGCVAASLAAGSASSIIKILPVRTKSPDGDEKDYFPGPREIHDALYPFHYSLYLYNAEAKAAVGLGFSAFILSNIGQKIIQKAGLVPVSIPYRTIQLTAE